MLERTVASMESHLEIVCNLLTEKLLEMPDKIIKAIQRGHETISMLDINNEMFPINSTQGLHEFNNKLRDDAEFKTLMIQKMSMLGGADANKAARAIAQYCFADEVLTLYSWLGKSGKLNFNIFKEIHSTIVVAVRKIHSYTEHENSKFFQEHLKHSSSRLLRKTLKTPVQITGKTNNCSPGINHLSEQSFRSHKDDSIDQMI